MNKKSLPQTLKGFRDFLPEEKRKRDFVMGKIKETFELFGFEPLETPTLEYASLLLDKYGKEANKLVYSFKDRGGRDVALRYDQTVPLSRVLNQNLVLNPSLLRRYQIQNVFRADKPQKGRYREFLQCDADIISDWTLFADAEILALFSAIYQNIGFKNLIIKVNDRQILFDILEPLSSNKLPVLSIIQIIDKLDKKTPDDIEKELVKKGLTQENAKKALKNINSAKPTENLKNIINSAQKLGVPEKSIKFSPSLARGLDYYTGLIFEGFIPDYDAGSIGGGGRYDKLISELTKVDEIKAVGFGLGFDRTVEAAKQAKLIPQFTTNAKVFVVGLERVGLTKSLEITNKLRDNNINTELLTEEADLNKQLKYVNKKGIPFVLIIGPDEIKANKVTLKDMKKRTEELLPLEKVIAKLK